MSLPPVYIALRSAKRLIVNITIVKYKVIICISQTRLLKQRVRRFVCLLVNCSTRTTPTDAVHLLISLVLFLARKLRNI